MCVNFSYCIQKKNENLPIAMTFQYQIRLCRFIQYYSCAYSHSMKNCEQKTYEYNSLKYYYKRNPFRSIYLTWNFAWKRFWLTPLFLHIPTRLRINQSIQGISCDSFHSKKRILYSLHTWTGFSIHNTKSNMPSMLQFDDWYDDFEIYLILWNG